MCLSFGLVDQRVSFPYQLSLSINILREESVEKKGFDSAKWSEQRKKKLSPRKRLFTSRGNAALEFIVKEDWLRCLLCIYIFIWIPVIRVRSCEAPSQSLEMFFRTFSLFTAFTFVVSTRPQKESLCSSLTSLSFICSFGPLTFQQPKKGLLQETNKFIRPG